MMTERWMKGKCIYLMLSLRLRTGAREMGEIKLFIGYRCILSGFFILALAQLVYHLAEQRYVQPYIFVPVFCFSFP